MEENELISREMIFWGLGEESIQYCHCESDLITRSMSKPGTCLEV